MSWQWKLAVVLVCVGTYVKPVEVDSPGLHVNILMYNTELVRVHWMSCGSTVEVYGGGGFEMFFNSFPQGSARLPNL